jgi:hypothetical protein
LVEIVTVQPLHHRDLRRIAGIDDGVVWFVSGLPRQDIHARAHPDAQQGDCENGGAE